jgi:hypothetical protein
VFNNGSGTSTRGDWSIRTTVEVQGGGVDLPWRRAAMEAELGKAELDLLKCKRLLHNTGRGGGEEGRTLVRSTTANTLSEQPPMCNTRLWLDLDWWRGYSSNKKQRA